MVYLNLKYSELNNNVKIEHKLITKKIILVLFVICLKKKINKNIPKKAFIVLDLSPVKKIANKKIIASMKKIFFCLK